MNPMVKLTAAFLEGTEEDRTFWVDPWAVECMYRDPGLDSASAIIMQINGQFHRIDNSTGDSIQRVLEARKQHIAIPDPS